MKVVILAGGLGSRLAEETSVRPKPLVEIGGMPILWHIMNIYAHHGLNDFIICAGYKGYMIKEYFVNLVLHHSDITVDLGANSINYHGGKRPDWRVTVVDTGMHSMTGGRLGRIREHLTPGEPFCMTYGDGVGDIDIAAEVAFHRDHGLKATMCAVTPPGRYGATNIEGQFITSFVEKPRGDGQRINGGFFVLDPSVIDLIPSDDTIWEAGPLEWLAANNQLAAFKHDGFWQPMDTLRERTHLEELWNSGKAPWKLWA
ncbi:glucose-1-phosphate cytidylyltransferase [Rhizobium sp. MC63]|jgi:glucose-1-phosphate cytidylyltransferase|uniref:Glucose-1-phosphate cytidylyltransferase n=1 Tax=Rhizobium mulingense TaxID=3031128 RepID=A0ACC6N0Z0_9HYPH|nr:MULTISPECIES: glucose-1-phosphate cytidylyltransferase [Rhizobium]MDF0695706.1 glucose-1-phosphate cytidylyltransferase [Rhizobium sp. MC63]MEA3519324.1 glucose-1-phosphate cytidylyltransferase [Rhizobium sp. MJ31]MEB3043191.1 glucose-1-phosphate cytidylyltransferase [Rhizobium sp. MJ21]PCK84833.1 glucose-1-phosphate cytidylyltransferase [Rhizobium sophoriradicis]ULR43923.1 glucose-1-phosphate cytidylyltransferase [Rhizobium sp. K102]